MRIAFTHDLRLSEREDDVEIDRPETVEAIIESLSRLGHEVEPIEVTGPVSRVVARIEALQPDLVFNTAKGRRGRSRAGVYPGLFDRLGVAFTGADAYASTLALDKHLTKLALAAQGISTSRSLFAPDLDALERAAGSLTFPVLARPNFEGRPAGKNEEAIVERSDELAERVSAWLERYPAGVLVEEHVAGTDLVVMYLEKASKAANGILPPAELPAALRERAVADSLKIVRALTLRDFGRIDYRLGADGHLYFLEADALPSLAPGALIYAAAEAAGAGGIDAVLEAIVQSASERFQIPAAVVRGKAKKKGLRVGLSFNLKRVASSPGGEVDQDAEYDSPKVIAAVKEAIASYGHEVIELEATAELPAILGTSGVDLVFNMAEGIRGRNREAQVPAILELLDIPYSGSDAATMSLALDKGLAKRVVAQAGIPTAPFVAMVSGKERLPKDFQFPAIVKPNAEGSSKGVLKTSVVESEAELRELVRMIVGKYRQAALVEAYLEGREFTVALLGERRPKVLPPMEIVFINPESKRPVYAFDHKLDWSTEIRYDRPAKLDPPLAKEIERVARGAFFALGCRDFARIDLRLDARGRVNFIEVNPLPGLSPGWSDLCLIAESAGMDYRTLIGEILAPAIRRWRDRRREMQQEAKGGVAGPAQVAPARRSATL